ncbi:MFS transporter [Bacillus canaveralius]|uniref:MFS transporter n=1 Tax=Bacillus canaveralius TaxID=1403243 RepID=A0A2N5GSG6_9BACI|nr:MFS transporter [Bacillus canaveralius]PLR86580.1 MFS transporter [Bacillus canaveralius]PLS00351.1 MFS transporter [Bacillus canaveralius]
MGKKKHYAWIILAVSFIGVLAAQGVRFSFGAFMASWEDYFSTNRGTVSAISFVSFLVFAVSQPIVGRLIDKLGVRKVFVISTFIVGASTLLSFFVTSVWQLFVLYGIIASLGFGGASGVTASVAVTKWFLKKQGLALGLVEAGFGAGQMVIVPSSLFLIDAYGWKWTVMILGVFLILVICPILAIFLKSEPSKAGLTALGSENTINVGSSTAEHKPVSKPNLANRKFWFLLIPFFICGVTTSGLMDTHLIPFTQFCGFTPAVTGAAVSTLAAFNIFGTLVSGILADRWSNKKILAFLYFTRAATIVFLMIFSSDPGLMKLFLDYPVLLFVFSISFGLVDFATVPPTIKLLSDYFKGQSVGLLTGWLFMSHQLGAALGSFIPGLLFDQTNSYQLSFMIAFVLLVVAGIFSALLPKVPQHR